MDPVVKESESPYVAFANNPIWFTDRNGADSALASGSTVWKWKAESGDWFSKISKRTGVSVDNLKRWNPGVPERNIPIGNELNISDPALPPSPTIPTISTSVGDIQVLYYGEGSNNSQTIALSLVPNEGRKEDYVFFQTFSTNDPKGANKTFDRELLESPLYGNDMDAGMRAALRFFPTAARSYPTHVDTPTRNPVSGIASWNGLITLHKKVDGLYIKVATFTFGFKVHGSEFVRDYLEYNPQKVENEHNNYHTLKFMEWSSPNK